MRSIRNVSLAVFALLAAATLTPTIQAHDCFDVSGINQCVGCGDNPDWYGPCYSGSNNCGDYDCGTPEGNGGTNCDGGGTIYICTCPKCF